MNILLFENSGIVSGQLLLKLQERGHFVHHAQSVRDARSIWDDEQVDCIIIDLNISPVGLKNSELSLTKGGLLTGWIWLNNYVLDTPGGEVMRDRTIIYSEFLHELRQSVEHSQLLGIRMISKSDSNSVTHIERSLSEIKGSLEQVKDA